MSLQTLTSVYEILLCCLLPLWHAVLSLYSLAFYKWKIDFLRVFFFHGYTVITERVNVGGFGEFGPCLPFLSGHLKVLICFLQLLLVLTIVSLKNCKRYSILCCVLGTY